MVFLKVIWKLLPHPPNVSESQHVARGNTKGSDDCTPPSRSPLHYAVTSFGRALGTSGKTRCNATQQTDEATSRANISFPP